MKLTLENGYMTDDEMLLKRRLQTLLKENVVEVSFTKVNGDERKMKCTLKPDFLPEPPDRGGQPGPEHTLPVWDIEKNGWRSFRIDSVHDYTVLRSNET
jgi:hypothetical protein